MDEATILKRFIAGEISLETAMALADALEQPQNGVRKCGGCDFFKDGQCVHPTQPPHPVHPRSIRCRHWEPYDERAHTFLVEDKPRGRMFK